MIRVSFGMLIAKIPLYLVVCPFLLLQSTNVTDGRTDVMIVA